MNEKSATIQHCDLIVTENCFLRCKMCHIWKHRKDDETIPFKTYIEFLSALKELSGKNTQIQFVGGEPLLKKGILDLISCASSHGFPTTMTTNGCLIDREMADGIIASGLNAIGFSLESLHGQRHDFLRGVPGTFKKVMDAISYFQDTSAPKDIFISTIINGTNLEDIIAIAEWVNKNPRLSFVYFQSVMQPFAMAEDDSWHQREEVRFLWPDTTAVHKVLDKLIALQKQGYKIANPPGQFNAFKNYFSDPRKFIKKIKCNLGHNAFSVLPNGDVFLCFSLPPIGNIMVDKIGAIWVSEKARKAREQISSCQKNCKLMINCFFENEESKIIK
ncbi:MAG: radical SAM protein [Candidatus Omnitrophica bacterium]|nr:radical SAM protein [Candidatus Omnitrophota bacterium]MDD5690514.1 radical SAM protein [Candidatus Omnitrophota bacterium]